MKHMAAFDGDDRGAVEKLLFEVRGLREVERLHDAFRLAQNPSSPISNSFS